MQLSKSRMGPRREIVQTILACVLLSALAAGCAPAPTPLPPVEQPTPSAQIPTATFTIPAPPTSTETLRPAPTALPSSTNTAAASPTVAPTTPAPTPTPVPLQFELLGVPGSYNAKPTHWSLVDLQLWHDRIYLAHGDLDANTGPVRALYVDTNTGKVVQDQGFAFDEEAIEKFELYDDVLYVPGIDAKESWDFGNVYLKTWGGTWAKRRTLPGAIHVYDIAALGKMLVVTGYTDRPVESGCFWTSVDQGLGWTPCYQLRPGITDSVSLYTSLFVLRDRVYVATPRDGCFVLANGTWLKANCLPEKHARIDKHAVFRDVAVMTPYWRDSGRQLYFYDGTVPWAVDFRWIVRDALATPEGLYVLTGISSGDGIIFFAPKLDCRCAADFSPVAEFSLSGEKHPSGNAPLSLEYAQGRFYLGLADGRLFRSEPLKK